MKSKMILSSITLLMGAVLVGIGVIAQQDEPAPDGGRGAVEAPEPAAEPTDGGRGGEPFVEPEPYNLPLPEPQPEPLPVFGGSSVGPGEVLIIPATNELALTEITEGTVTNDLEQPEGAVEFTAVPVDDNPIEGALVETNAVAANLITIQLDDVEMADVVKMFTRISGANIIASPSNLQGRVSVSLSNVEWKPAMESILDLHNLQLYEKQAGSGVYSIVQKIPGQQDPLIVETIFLSYAAVSSVTEVVKTMLPAGASVSAFPSRGALVLRTTSANLAEVKKVIGQIDKVRGQVSIEAKFLELSDKAMEKLGVDWSSLGQFKVTAAGMGMSYNQEQKWTDTRTDTLSEWQNLQYQDNMWQGFDTDGTEVDEVTYESALVTPDADTVTGTEQYLGHEVVDTIDEGQNLQTDISEGFSDTITQARGAVLSATEFSLILSALKGTEGATIVSNPKIVVANEEPAKIHIGETRRPFISSVVQDPTGNSAPIINYNPGEPVDYGVKLTVTPTINTDSNITVTIEPELVRDAGDEVAPNQQTYPVISKKSIRTVFCLESGRTVAIGGLTETVEGKKTTKVPLLGDIPIIGKYLFSHRDNSTEQKETIIFVTVALARPDQIESESALPSDTKLTKKRLVIDEMQRKQFDKELEKMRQTAESEEPEDADAKERLLRQTK